MASLSLLFGIVVGLRFNVRLLFLICLMVVTGSLAAMAFGIAPPASAALFAVSTTVALQVGYFVSMVIGAMNLTDTPESSAVRPPAGEPSRAGLETPRM